MSDNDGGGSERLAPSKDELESAISVKVRDEFGGQALEGRDRVEALDNHRHHLVRDTTSKKTIHRDLGPGAEAEVTAEVPDTYCFTCSEWVGLSGLNLTGTPRSKADAYYLDGPPGVIRDLRHEVRLAFGSLLSVTVSNHPDVDDREEAADFIRGEMEQADDLVAVADGGNARSLHTDN